MGDLQESATDTSPLSHFSFFHTCVCNFACSVQSLCAWQPIALQELDKFTHVVLLFLILCETVCTDGTPLNSVFFSSLWLVLRCAAFSCEQFTAKLNKTHHT